MGQVARRLRGTGLISAFHLAWQRSRFIHPDARCTASAIAGASVLHLNNKAQPGKYCHESPRTALFRSPGWFVTSALCCVVLRASCEDAWIVFACIHLYAF